MLGILLFYIIQLMYYIYLAMLVLHFIFVNWVPQQLSTDYGRIIDSLTLITRQFTPVSLTINNKKIDFSSIVVLVILIIVWMIVLEPLMRWLLIAK